MSGIRPADPRLRKRLLILIAISLVIFIAAETSGLFDFGALFKDLQGEALLQRLRLVFTLLFLPLIPMGLYLIHFGLRILRSGEFPPPGAWLIRPTRIQTGRWAGFRGWMVILAGASLCVLGVYGAVILPGELERTLLQPDDRSSLSSPHLTAGS